MKHSRAYLPSSRQIILLVGILLLATSSLAQKVESETQGATPPAQSSETDPGAGENTGETQSPRPAKSKAATHFTPTEKIHADDAVSFPVDI